MREENAGSSTERRVISNSVIPHRAIRDIREEGRERPVRKIIAHEEWDGECETLYTSNHFIDNQSTGTDAIPSACPPFNFSLLYIERGFFYLFFFIPFADQHRHIYI